MAYKDRTGIEETCPLINDVRDAVKSCYASEQAISLNEMRNIESTLEDIRQANGGLRTIALDSLSKIEDLEGDLSYWERKYNDANDEVADLTKELTRIKALTPEQFAAEFGGAE